MRWALVEREGFLVPLIGVPASATREKCQQCGAEVEMTSGTLDAEGAFRCLDCLRACWWNSGWQRAWVKSPNFSPRMARCWQGWEKANNRLLKPHEPRRTKPNR